MFRSPSVDNQNSIKIRSGPQVNQRETPGGSKARGDHGKQDLRESAVNKGEEDEKRFSKHSQ